MIAGPSASFYARLLHDVGAVYLGGELDGTLGASLRALGVSMMARGIFGLTLGSALFELGLGGGPIFVYEPHTVGTTTVALLIGVHLGLGARIGEDSSLMLRTGLYLGGGDTAYAGAMASLGWEW